MRNRVKIELSTELESHGPTFARVYVERLAKYRTGKYNEAESQLHDIFLCRSYDGLVCNTLWFKNTMIDLVRTLYPVGSSSQFIASDHWRQNFFSRFRISFRVTTRKQPLPIAERIGIITEFYKMVRFACQPGPDEVCSSIAFWDWEYGRFPLSHRHHADQVPLDFIGVLSRTAAPIGAQSVHLRTPKIKMEHRVASLMLCFTADSRENGYQRAAICFALVPSQNTAGEIDPRWPAGQHTRKQFVDLKGRFPDILFYAQKSGYFDNKTCLAWLQDTLPSLAKSSDHLLCLDNLGGHTSPLFRRHAWDNKPRVWIIYTPPDCTDACAVTDDGLGQAIKRSMRLSFEEHFAANMALWQGEEGHTPITAHARRELYAQWLHKAVHVFYGFNDKNGRWGHHSVRRAFERCGMANGLSGKDNALIRIQGWDEPIDL